VRQHRVSSLVDVNETRGVGVHKRITALGVGIVLDVQKTDDMMMGSVGPVNLGDNVVVLLNSGEVRVFCEESLRTISHS